MQKAIGTTVILSTVILSSSVMCQAARGIWNVKERPTLTLGQALSFAERALHKRAKDFYCVRANLAKNHSSKGDWTFKFNSNNGETRWVVVTLEKKVWVSKQPPMVF